MAHTPNGQDPASGQLLSPAGTIESIRRTQALAHEVAEHAAHPVQSPQAATRLATLA